MSLRFLVDRAITAHKATGRGKPQAIYLGEVEHTSLRGDAEAHGVLIDEHDETFEYHGARVFLVNARNHVGVA